LQNHHDQYFFLYVPHVFAKNMHYDKYGTHIRQIWHPYYDKYGTTFFFSKSGMHASKSQLHLIKTGCDAGDISNINPFYCNIRIFVCISEEFDENV